MYGLHVGRALHGPLAGLVPVADRLSMETGCHGVMRHQFRLGGDDVGKLCRQGLGDALMVGLSGTWQQRGIGHLLGEDVLEGIGRRGHAVRCQEELGRLQVLEPLLQRRRGKRCHGLKQGERHVLPHDGGEVEDVFCRGRQAVDAGRQDGLDGLRYAPGCRLRARSRTV